MAGEFGGIAEKFGNRYEALWCVRELIRVVAEEIISVTVEKIGADSEGVDLWVERKDGTREAQQCKRRNASKGKWTIRDLRQRGVLSALTKHLQRSENHQFAFISGDPAPELMDLCERARLANETEEFHENFVSSKQGGTRAFQGFCSQLSLDPSIAHDRVIAYGMLRRSRAQIVDAGEGGKQEIRMWVRRYIDGDETAVIALLADLVVESLNRPLYSDIIREHLSLSGFSLRHIANDPCLAPRIQALQTEFVEQLTGPLICKTLISRPETNKLIEWFDSDNSPRLAVLSGAKGRGKSTVLLEFTRHLLERGVPVLPLRIDRRSPVTSARQFGIQSCDLPESPALCIAERAGARRAILILDQLDAVRWSSAHSAVKISVIQETITEAMATSDIRILIACRTFDLREDLQIGTCIAKHEHVVIDVGDLPEESVAQIIKGCGHDFERLTDAQRRILRSADMLAIWTRVQSGRTAFEFRTASDLMRQFFIDRRNDSHAMGLASGELDKAMDCVVEEMCRLESIHAPIDCLDKCPRAADALRSLGILVSTNGQFTFCHQGYLEYLIADLGLRAIRSNQQSLVRWIGKEQTLLRREPLRQILLHLRDDDPKAFLAAVHELVLNQDVRFHIQHLAVQLIAYLDESNPAEIEYVLKLVDDSTWREIVLSFLVGQPVWYKHLLNRGVIYQWLTSGEPEMVKNARWLTINVADKCGDEIASLVLPILKSENGDQLRPVFTQMLPFDPGDDTRSLFEIRLQLIQGDIARFDFEMLDLRKLSERHPEWCIELAATFLGTLELSLRKGGPNRRKAPHVEKEFTAAAERAPLLALERLLPYVERLAAASPSDFKSSQPFVADEFWAGRYGDETSLTFILNALQAAGQRLAEIEPHSFWKIVTQWSGSRFRVIQCVLLRTMECVPVEHANQVFDWLLSDRRRFRLGESNARVSCGNARRVIARHAPHCDGPTYEHLERFILGHTEDRELDSIRSLHERRMKGDYSISNYLGSSRQVLLAGLPETRMSEIALSMKGYLDRKFGSYDFQQESRRSVSGGMVTSSLGERARRYLTDRQWLRIIYPEQAERPRTRRRVGNDHVRESSPEQFAKTLEDHAHKEPMRFAKLALRLVADADYHYVCAILEGLGATEPPGNLKDDERDSWVPASVAEVEGVLDLASGRAETDIAMSACRLFDKRKEELWSDNMISLLCRYATEHPHPAPDQFTCSRSSKSGGMNYVPDVAGSALNCVRGSACHALMQLLFEHKPPYDRIKPTLEAIVRDPSPSVRVAAAGVCLPILNINRKEAVRLFVACCDIGDDRILNSLEVTEFMRFAWREHSKSVEPVIRRMVNSKIPDVRRIGAQFVTALSLYKNRLLRLFERCRKSTKSRRLGVAQVARDCILDADVTDRCVRILEEAFDDDVREVRADAARVFYQKGILSHPVGQKLASVFVASGAFLESPGSLLHPLEQYAGELSPYSQIIERICHAFGGPLKEASQDMRTAIAGDVRMLPRLVLRLYDEAEQKKDKEIRSEALNLFDAMLRTNLMGSRDILRHLDG